MEISPAIAGLSTYRLRRQQSVPSITPSLANAPYVLGQGARGQLPVDRRNSPSKRHIVLGSNDRSSEVRRRRAERQPKTFWCDEIEQWVGTLAWGRSVCAALGERPGAGRDEYHRCSAGERVLSRNSSRMPLPVTARAKPDSSHPGHRMVSQLPCWRSMAQPPTLLHQRWSMTSSCPLEVRQSDRCRTTR